MGNGKCVQSIGEFFNVWKEVFRDIRRSWDVPLSTFPLLTWYGAGCGRMMQQDPTLSLLER